MSARAIWKGVIEFGDVSVPVKLYSAIEDKSVSFRLLSRDDGEPVRQALVNPKTKEVVEYAESQRGYVTDKGELVTLDEEELEELEPEASRTIEVVRFVPPEAIESRWYLRPYYLGPDGDDDAYFTLAAALASSELEGVAHWVMRDKEYSGALRLHQGYPMLVTLRNSEEILPLEQLKPAASDDLDEKQLKMARQLIEMLAADFEPEQYVDDYRESVLELVEKKQSGATVKAPKARKKKATSDLTSALEKSLKAGGKSAGGRSGGKSSGGKSSGNKSSGERGKGEGKGGRA